MPKLSICIPCFNKFNFTKSILKDLSYLSNDHQIIVFDNGSTDETEKSLKNSNEILYLRSETNLGFGAACNKMYEVAGAENVMFLNNDVKVRSNHFNWTENIINKCSEGIVGPTMGQVDNKFNFIKEANHILLGNSYVSGWCIASSRNIWEKLKEEGAIGPWAPYYFAYFEDTHMGFMCRKLGIPMLTVDVPIVHFGKVSSKQLNTYALYSKSKEIFSKIWRT